MFNFDTNEPWKFTDGIEFTFPAAPNDIMIPKDGFLLIVRNPDAFEARFGVLPNVLGPYSGRLSDAGETLEIGMPGDIDEYGTRQYIRVDRVNYSDGNHPENCPGGVDLWWPQADGNGASLVRMDVDRYGNDPNNWTWTDPPTPGE